MTEQAQLEILLAQPLYIRCPSSSYYYKDLKFQDASQMSGVAGT